MYICCWPQNWKTDACFLLHKRVHKPKMFPTPTKASFPPSRFAETRITQGGPKYCTVKWSCIHCMCCLVYDGTFSTHCVQVNINGKSVWFWRVFKNNYASEHKHDLCRFVGFKNTKTTHWHTHSSPSCFLSFHRSVVHGKRRERQIIGTSPYIYIYLWTWLQGLRVPTSPPWQYHPHKRVQIIKYRRLYAFLCV